MVEMFAEAGTDAGLTSEIDLLLVERTEPTEGCVTRAAAGNRAHTQPRLADATMGTDAWVCPER